MLILRGFRSTPIILVPGVREQIVHGLITPPGTYRALSADSTAGPFGTAGDDAAENGPPAELHKQWIGHSSLKMTGRYSHTGQEADYRQNAARRVRLDLIVGRNLPNWTQAAPKRNVDRKGYPVKRISGWPCRARTCDLLVRSGKKGANQGQRDPAAPNIFERLRAAETTRHDPEPRRIVCRLSVTGDQNISPWNHIGQWLRLLEQLKNAAWTTNQVL